MLIYVLFSKASHQGSVHRHILVVDADEMVGYLWRHVVVGANEMAVDKIPLLAGIPCLEGRRGEKDDRNCTRYGRL